VRTLRHARQPAPHSNECSRRRTSGYQPLGISGLGVIGLSYAIHQLTAGTRGSFVGSLLIGVYGLGGLVVAVFPTDRIDSRTDVMSQSTTGWIHSLTSLVSYLCVIVGMFILTWTFAHQARWRFARRMVVPYRGCRVVPAVRAG
jgi:hypothetical protein